MACSDTWKPSHYLEMTLYHPWKAFFVPWMTLHPTKLIKLMAEPIKLMVEHA
jgi:hypothetical protein